MMQEHATVKSHVSAGHHQEEPAEALRLQFAEAWGDMSASWGVAPAIGRVHAYLMVRGVPLTEREVREALGLSHRAASLALAEAEEWGIVEKVPEPRRVGRRGPAGTAYVAIGDHWQWFTSVIAGRKAREGDPIVAVIEKTRAEAVEAAKDHPNDLELLRLRDWLTAFAGFVRLFDRAVGLIPKLEPRELERGMRLDLRRDDPAARPPPGRAARRGRPGARRSPQPPLADGRPPGDEADVGGRPDRRTVG
jgi:DNA-binding transcriptional regulator GbsR (MarR family)